MDLKRRVSIPLAIFASRLSRCAGCCCRRCRRFSRDGNCRVFSRAFPSSAFGLTTVILKGHLIVLCVHAGQLVSVLTGPKKYQQKTAPVWSKYKTSHAQITVANCESPRCLLYAFYLFIYAGLLVCPTPLLGRFSAGRMTTPKTTMAAGGVKRRRQDGLQRMSARGSFVSDADFEPPAAKRKPNRVLVFASIPLDGDADPVAATPAPAKRLFEPLGAKNGDPQPNQSAPSGESLMQALCDAMEQVRCGGGATADFLTHYRLEHRATALAIFADLSAGKIPGRPYPSYSHAVLISAFAYMFQMAVVSDVLAEFVCQRVPVACMLGFDALVEVIHACELIGRPTDPVARFSREVLMRHNTAMRKMGRAVDGPALMTKWLVSIPPLAGARVTTEDVRRWGPEPTKGKRGDSNITQAPASYYVPFETALVAYAGYNRARRDDVDIQQPQPLLPILCWGQAYIPNERQNDGLLLRCAILLLRKNIREAIKQLRQYIAGEGVDPELVACIAAATEQLPLATTTAAPGSDSFSNRGPFGLPFVEQADAIRAACQQPMTAALHATILPGVPVLRDARRVLVEMGVYSATAAAEPAAGVTALLHADPLANIDRGFGSLKDDGSGAARLWPESMLLEKNLVQALARPSRETMDAVLEALARAVAPCVVSIAIQAATIKDGQALPGQKFDFHRRTFFLERLAVSGVTPETARAVVQLLGTACKTKDKANELGDLNLWIWRHQQRHQRPQTAAAGAEQTLHTFSGRGCRRIRKDLPGVCAFLPSRETDSALTVSGVNAVRRVLTVLKFESDGPVAADKVALAGIFSEMRAPAKFKEAVEACTARDQTGETDIEDIALPLWSKRDKFASKACFDCLNRVRDVRGSGSWVGHPQMYSCDDSGA